MPTPTTADLIERFGPPDDLSDEGDTEGSSNVIRVASMHNAIADFAAQNDLSEAPYDSPDLLEEIVGDMISNLLHVLTMHGGDAELTNDRAWHHFQREVGRGYGVPS
jgi:hypothetical protein